MKYRIFAKGQSNEGPITPPSKQANRFIRLTKMGYIGIARYKDGEHLLIEPEFYDESYAKKYADNFKRMAELLEDRLKNHPDLKGLDLFDFGKVDDRPINYDTSATSKAADSIMNSLKPPTPCKNQTDHRP